MECADSVALQQGFVKSSIYGGLSRAWTIKCRNAGFPMFKTHARLGASSLTRLQVLCLLDFEIFMR